ncbi:MAG: toll/interleukin-1 receptor domain-containing protein [Acetobacterium sp.]
MEKPTIFFSHSSKDRDAILEIKNKLDKITSGVLNVFMSSDGQSIPLGHNWLHKIEEGLATASIMFVFVTPNSIDSKWIHFEAGFAYSKNIEVIPVGIGIDIVMLEAPLSILQGFNITSGESLNNLVSVVNKKYQLNFVETFSEIDYASAIKNNKFGAIDKIMHKIFKSIQYELWDKVNISHKEILECDLDKYFEKIHEFLKNSSIQFSMKKDKLKNSILTKGINIKYVFKSENSPAEKPGKIIFSMSTINFCESFSLLKEILQLDGVYLEKRYLHFRLNPSYSYIVNDTDLASVLSRVQDTIGFDRNKIGKYYYLQTGMSFAIFDMYNEGMKDFHDYVLNIVYDLKNTTAIELQEFADFLVEKKVIYEISV